MCSRRALFVRAYGYHKPVSPIHPLLHQRYSFSIIRPLCKGHSSSSALRPLRQFCSGYFGQTLVALQSYRANVNGGPDEDINVEWTSADYYKRLGLTSEATSAAIRERYLTLAKRYHPDASGQADNAAAFTAIKEAYETLIDDTKRKAYDGLGHRAYTEAESTAAGAAEQFLHEQAIRQLFKDGLHNFIFSVLLVSLFIAYHYRRRTGSSSYLHYWVILAVLGLFPRLIAFALMIAMFTSDRIEQWEALEQAQGALKVLVRRVAYKADIDKKPSPALAPAEVVLEASGLGTAAEEAQMVVEVERLGPSDANGDKDSSRSSTGIKETFVFAPGVLRVSLPLILADRRPAADDDTQAGPTYAIHTRVVNDTTKTTHIDRVILIR